MSAESVRHAFLRQAKACQELGSPFTAQLCALLSERLDETGAVGSMVFAWPRDPTGTGDVVALRLAGALHALVLSGAAPRLVAIYPPHRASADTIWQTVKTALIEHASFILARLDSAPQTNEVRRSAALLPGFLTIADLFDLPLVLSESGASAGLNLHWDRYQYDLGGFLWGPPSPVRLAPDWTGTAPPLATVKVRERRACDLNPLDPRDTEDRLRLLSYIWADQPDRLERTSNAAEIAAMSGDTVEKADAVEWLAQRLETPQGGAVHVIYHTIAWQYLPQALKVTGTELIGEAGRKATTDAPLARLQLEADGNSPGAAIRLQIWPSGEIREIGRADFHGRWVDWKGWRR